MVHTWRSENNFVELVVSFHFYVGSGDPTGVSGTYSKCLYLLSHLVGSRSETF